MGLQLSRLRHASDQQASSAAAAATATAAVGDTDARFVADVLTAVLRRHDMHELALVSPLEYATLCALAYDNKAKPPHGWTMLLSTTQCQLEREGYSAVAYIHTARRLCVVAQRGTADVFGLRAAVWLHFDEYTVQLCLAEQFSRLVRQRLAAHASCKHDDDDVDDKDKKKQCNDNDDDDECTKSSSSDSSDADGEGDYGDNASGKEADVVDVGDWRLSYTGHSLGALVAAYRAAVERVVAVTFESAGGRSFLQRSLDARAFAAAEANTVSYVCAPNPINTLRAHVGLVVCVPVVLDAQLPHMTAAGGMALLPSSVPAAATPLPLPPPSSSMPTHTTTTTAAAAAVAATTPCQAHSCHNNNSASVSSRRVASATTHTTPAAVSPTTLQQSSSDAAAATTSSSWRARLTMPSLRVPAIRSYAMTYTRDYMLGSVGVPELQQYITRIEPMVRAMLEQTCQMHTVHNFVRYFDAAQQQRQQTSQTHHHDDNDSSSSAVTKAHDAVAAPEMLVLRWPSNLMQYIEYCNAARALCDAEARATASVRVAYEALLRRVYATTSLQPRRLPLRYVSAPARTLLRVWQHCRARALLAPRLRAHDTHSDAVALDANDDAAVAAVTAVAIVDAPQDNKDTAAAPVHRSADSRAWRDLLRALRLTRNDVKVLNAVTVDARGMWLVCAAPLTALQAKLYLTLLVSRPRVRRALRRVAPHVRVVGDAVAQSKL